MTSKDTNPKDAIGTKKWRQFTVVPFQVIWEVGVGMLEGALKYGRHNYRASGVRASVYVDAALGHIHQYWEGEDIDPDSTAHLHHITKAITSLTVLRDAMMNDFYVDDRPPKIKDMDSIRTQLQSAVEELFKEHADKDPHHYVHTEDGAPYRGGSAVREDRFAEERERLDEILNRVHEENRRDRSLGSMFESLFGSFPDGYSMKTERIGDLEVTTIAPDDHPWNASDADMDDEDSLSHAAAEIDEEPGGLMACSPELMKAMEERPFEEDVSDHISVDGVVARLVFPSEMQIGRWYRATKLHTGQVVDTRKGGIWHVIRKEGDLAFGVKPGWRDDHKGTKLAPSTQFVEVQPRAALTPDTAWSAVREEDETPPHGFDDIRDGMAMAVKEERRFASAAAEMHEKERIREEQELESMRAIFEHVNAIDIPGHMRTAGLTDSALALLEEWRLMDGMQAFDPDTPMAARALASRQWATRKGIITA